MPGGIYQQPIQRRGTGTGDSEPHEGGEIGRLLEAEQGFQRIHRFPFCGFDRNHHHDRQHRRRDPREQAEDQHDAAEEFDAGHDGGEQFRKRDAPFGKMLDHLRQIVELAPAGQHEDVADDQPHQQRPGPGEIGCDPGRQQDQEIDDEIHWVTPPNIVVTSAAGGRPLN